MPAPIKVLYHRRVNTGSSGLAAAADPVENRPSRLSGIWRIALLGLALQLGACAHYQPAPLQPGDSATEFSARRLDAPELRDRVAAMLPQADASWPPATWNRGQLLAIALVWNPQIAVARAQVEAALAHETAAGQLPNPQLTLQSEYAKREPHPWLYGLSLDLLWATGKRRQLDREAARIESSAARWQLMDQAWAVRNALLKAASDRESAARRLDLLERLSSAQQKVVALQRRRIAAGEDAADEALVASQAQIEIEQQQTQSRTELATAGAALAAALGVVPAAIDGIRVDWSEWGQPPSIDAATLDQAREQALRSRSDLSATLDAYAVAENKLHQAVLRQYPQFHLSPGYYWDHGIAKFPFNVGFDLPLNGNAGEIAEARAARDVAGRRMLAAQAEIIGAIEAAGRAETLARGSVDAAERGLGTARDQRRNAALTLRLGGIAAHEDLAAEALALRSELQNVQARAQLQSARNALEDALHAPLSGPELQLSTALPVAVAGATR
jgi:CRISPR system Cascade subunit CasA